MLSLYSPGEMDRLPGITSVAAFYIHITIRPPARTRKQKRCIKGLCHGWLVQFFLKINASYSSLFAERP